MSILDLLGIDTTDFSAVTQQELHNAVEYYRATMATATLDASDFEPGIAAEVYISPTLQQLYTADRDVFVSGNYIADVRNGIGIIPTSSNYFLASATCPDATTAHIMKFIANPRHGFASFRITLNDTNFTSTSFTVKSPDGIIRSFRLAAGAKSGAVTIPILKQMRTRTEILDATDPFNQVFSETVLDDSRKFEYCTSKECLWEVTATNLRVEMRPLFMTTMQGAMFYSAIAFGHTSTGILSAMDVADQLDPNGHHNSEKLTKAIRDGGMVELLRGGDGSPDSLGAVGLKPTYTPSQAHKSLG